MGSRRQLLDLQLNEIDTVIERSVSAALATRMSRRSHSASLERSRALEQVRLQDLLREWLVEERKRPDFTVLEREEQKTAEVGGVTLQIKADRVDRYADGTHAILDYKTSDKQGVKDWESDRPNAPQLMLYAVRSEHLISSVEFAFLVPHDTGLEGYKGPELQQRLPEWTRVVEQLGASFSRGDAAVDPKYGLKSCEFCQLHSLCRIADVRAFNAAEDDAGE